MKENPVENKTIPKVGSDLLKQLRAVGEGKLSGKYKCKICGKAITKFDYDNNRQTCYPCDKNIPKDMQARQADSFFKEVEKSGL